MNKGKVLAGVLSALIIVACILVSFSFFEKKALEEYDIIFFGDSIVASDYSEWWDISTLISNETNYKVLNAGYGGYTMSNRSVSAYSGDPRRLFSMIGLSESVRITDFSMQVAASPEVNNVSWYFPTVSRHLNNVNWENVKYIFIEQAANDYLYGIPADDGEDKYNEFTFGGALRKSIENIREGVPNAHIILVTPIYMKPEGFSGDCNSKDFGGGYLRDYVNKEIEIANEYGLYVIDDFHEIDINSENYEQFIPGGLHPNLEGNQMIADNIVGHLKELYENP